DQLVPFHRSTNVVPPPVPPTAKQLVGLGHDTRPSARVGGPNGFGLAETDHRGVAPTGDAPAPTRPATRPTAKPSRTNAERCNRRRHHDGLASGRMGNPPQPPYPSLTVRQSAVACASPRLPDACNPVVSTRRRSV